jgi:hypothetical protein
MDIMKKWSDAFLKAIRLTPKHGRRLAQLMESMNTNR